MSGFISALKSGVELMKRGDDDAYDRISSRYSVAICLVFAFLVSGGVYPFFASSPCNLASSSIGALDTPQLILSHDSGAGDGVVFGVTIGITLVSLWYRYGLSTEHKGLPLVGMYSNSRQLLLSNVAVAW